MWVGVERRCFIFSVHVQIQAVLARGSKTMSLSAGLVDAFLAKPQTATHTPSFDKHCVCGESRVRNYRSKAIFNDYSNQGNWMKVRRSENLKRMGIYKLVLTNQKKSISGRKPIETKILPPGGISLCTA